MNYGICNETYQDWPFADAFAHAAALGYTGIEFAPFTMIEGDGPKDARAISGHTRESVRRQAEDAGLSVIGLHWLLAFTEGYYLTTPDADTRQATADYLGELSALCRDLGGSIMVLGSPLQRNLLPGVTHDRAMEYAADVLSRATDAFAAHNVTLAVEPLGPEEGDFLLTAADGRELVDRVDHPNCRLHLDVKAMSSESTSIETIIRDSAEYCVHFHANDANRRGPGMGEIDFVPILRTLKEVGYDRWISVEVFDYEPGVEALATESLRYLQSCDEQVSPSS